MTVAYFDDGTVFSSLPFSELAANIVLWGDSIYSEPVVSLLIISYTDATTPVGTVEKDTIFYS